VAAAAGNIWQAKIKTATSITGSAHKSLGKRAESSRYAFLPNYPMMAELKHCGFEDKTATVYQNFRALAHILRFYLIRRML